jgi:hypothetical protein
MTKFRTLPMFGNDPRNVAEVVRGIMDGKTNNTGTITLATGNSATTTLYDERIGYESLIYFVPVSNAAYDDNAPYGAFASSASQSAANTTTGYAFTYNTTEQSNGVYISNSSQLNVRNYGIYNVQFSAQYKNTTNDGQDVDIWFAVNGANIVDSNSKFHIPARKSTGDPSYLIAALNIFLELQAGDYVEIFWSTTSTSVTVEALSAQSSPTRPATPSVIATIQYIAPSATSNLYISAQQQGQATISHWANDTADKTYGYIIVG